MLVGGISWGNMVFLGGGGVVCTILYCVVLCCVVLGAVVCVRGRCDRADQGDERGGGRGGDGGGHVWVFVGGVGGRLG